MEQINSRLILVSGLPGSGKSTCGRWLSKEYGISYVDYDSVIQGFMSDIYDKFYNQAPYDEFCLIWRERCYETFWNVVADNLRAGISVVASAPLSKEAEKAEFFDEMKAKWNLEYEVLSVTFEIPNEELFIRLSRRNEKRDCQKLGNWGEYCRKPRREAIWNPDFQIIYGPQEEYKSDKRIEDFLCGKWRNGTKEEKI